MAGQYAFAKSSQIPYSLSTATGYRMPRSLVRAVTLARSRSKPNSGVCTPTTESPASAYLSCQAWRYGSVRSQFTQVNVQKSTRTTRLLRPADVNGGEFSHAVARSNGGRRPSSGNVSPPASRWAIERNGPGRDRPAVAVRPSVPAAESTDMRHLRAGLGALRDPVDVDHRVGERAGRLLGQIVP